MRSGKFDVCIKLVTVNGGARIVIPTPKRMQQTRKPVSKVKVAVMWAVLLGNIVFWCGFWIWHYRNDSPPDEAGTGLFRALGMIVIGGFFLVAGVLSYIAVLFSNCLTFNFNEPVWRAFKPKLFLANIIVPLLGALGIGFILSAFATPALSGFGIVPGVAGLLPVMVMVAVLQVCQMWIQIWAPLERRLIRKRLKSQGLSDAQLQTAVLVGLSDPRRSSFKKFGRIEEDVGALWIAPEQLVYYGDVERFSITREQLVQIERRSDAGSVSILSGMAHVILHVRLPDGSERQVRFHIEGVPTQGVKRKVMDQLADAIVHWHSSAAPAAIA
jgi:hypothetical protein